MFGATNATITEIYDQNEQSRTDVGGQLNLDTPTAVVLRVWFEEVSDERIVVAGDTFNRRAQVSGRFGITLAEGDILTILPDQVGGESEPDTRYWKIENLDIPAGLSHGVNRIRRMDLELIEYTTS